MADSGFWRFMAAAFVCGLFYLGHGLHNPGENIVPPLTQEVQAGDVATAITPNNSRMKIITSSADGQKINVWSSSSTNNSVTFVGTFPAAK